MEGGETSSPGATSAPCHVGHMASTFSVHAAAHMALDIPPAPPQVFEKLGPSLFDFMRKNEYRPFPIDLVQEFSRQLIQAVAYLHGLQVGGLRAGVCFGAFVCGVCLFVSGRVSKVGADLHGLQVGGGGCALGGACLPACAWVCG